MRDGRLVLVLSLIVSGCGGGGGDDGVPAEPDGGLADARPDLDDPPVANAGPDRGVPRNTHVVLDGRASFDPEGQPLSYAWLQIAAPATSAAHLAGIDTATPEIVVDVVGFYEMSLVVSDGTQTSAPDLVRVAVMDAEPLAHAGSDVSVEKGSVATLDGSASIDPDGDALSYTWTLASAPAGSAATLAGADTVAPTLATDRPGSYVVRLVVTDGDSTSTPDTVIVTATNEVPAAEAGADVELQLGATATLDGAPSTDGDDAALTFAWTVVQRPAGSTAAPATPAAAQTTLTPDVAGEYVVRLTVGDGFATATDTVRVLVEAVVADLGHQVVDAEYSASLDRIVTLASDATVHVVDPATGDGVEIGLPLIGTSLSLSPDGSEAVVGHDGWISRIDLAHADLVATLPVTAPAGDVIHGGNGWAYVLPSEDQWVQVHSINLASGAETLGGSWSIYAGMVGRRHPTMPAIYLADRYLSPSDIERHDIAGGAAVFGYDSPYHGDYPMCGDLWFSEDGARIFTRCGNVFHATAERATDMTYAGSLSETGLIVSLAHSAAAGKVVAIPGNDWDDPDDDVELHFYDDEFLAFSGTRPLPPLLGDHELAPGHGRFVFVDADGVTVHVIARTGGAEPRDVLWSTTY